ncbi:hypothetical protein RHSIM_Rhsim11G0022200 [Rhododendron simsii]|uniref:Uncharacterized protein n=1 Tax=Rhododendron simsii TaxID=118357 RepID=A0A834G739_RHOSS|nr:hypothetical protein RHSIM_Rhsim11G0022200 [Rhododendron simsii]
MRSKDVLLCKGYVCLSSFHSQPCKGHDCCKYGDIDRQRVQGQVEEFFLIESSIELANLDEPAAFDSTVLPGVTGKCSYSYAGHFSLPRAELDIWINKQIYSSHQIYDSLETSVLPSAWLPSVLLADDYLLQFAYVWTPQSSINQVELRCISGTLDLTYSISLYLLSMEASVIVKNNDKKVMNLIGGIPNHLKFRKRAGAKPL